MLRSCFCVLYGEHFALNSRKFKKSFGVFIVFWCRKRLITARQVLKLLFFLAKYR
jgi:hypothetical protein